MGGGHHFHYPKWVWSPAGGWWGKPKQWKRDTVIFYLVSGAMLYGLYNWTEANTVSRPSFYYAILYNQSINYFCLIALLWMLLQKKYIPATPPKFEIKDDHHH